MAVHIPAGLMMRSEPAYISRLVHLRISVVHDSSIVELIAEISVLVVPLRTLSRLQPHSSPVLQRLM